MFWIKKPKESLDWLRKLTLHTLKGKTILNLLELRSKMKEIKELLNNNPAYIADKYWREPWITLGHFIAFKRGIYGCELTFDVNLKFGEDIDFGKKVYKVYGAEAIYYDRNNFILASARRIRKVGLINYVLGYKY